LSDEPNVHGPLKLAAARLADAGRGVHEIASITGHRSLSMIQLRPWSAGQERPAPAAITRLSRRDGKRLSVSKKSSQEQ
jgi:hypothetical protein